MLLHAKFIVDFIFNVVPFAQHIFRFRFMPFYGHKFTSSHTARGAGGEPEVALKL